MYCCEGWHSPSFPQAIDCPSWWSDYCPGTALEGWVSSGAPLAYLPTHEDITGTPVLRTCSQVLKDRFWETAFFLSSLTLIQSKSNFSEALNKKAVITEIIVRVIAASISQGRHDYPVFFIMLGILMVLELMWRDRCRADG